MSSARYDSEGNLAKRSSPSKKKKTRDFDDLKVKTLQPHKTDKYKPWRHPLDEFVDDDLDNEFV